MMERGTYKYEPFIYQKLFEVENEEEPFQKIQEFFVFIIIIIIYSFISEM